MKTIEDRLAGLPSSPEPSTELATISAIQQIVPAEFFRAGGSNDILTRLEIEVRAEAAKLDISTEKGRKAIASLAYKVACSKKPLETLKKDLTEEIRLQKAAIDAEGRSAIDRVEALQKEVRKPLTDWEDAEKERVAAHEKALADIRDSVDWWGQRWQTVGSDAIRRRIQAIEDERRDWQEFNLRAEGTKALAIRSMRSLLMLAEQDETQKAEAERQRKEADEKAIREREEAAAARAKAEAERKAQEALEAAQRAAQAEQQRLENERHEAEARAKQAEARRVAEAEAAAERERQAERQRLEDLRQAELRREREAAESKRREEAAVQAEKDRQAAEQKRKDDAAEADRLAEEKRTANKKHRARIEGEILAALKVEFDGEDARDLNVIVLEAIKEGRIPHVTIAY